MTRTPARVKAANAGQATRAHVTLGSFSTHGFARAAITIITGLWLCERATGAWPGLRLFCEIDLTYSLAYANRQCYASETRASLPFPSSAIETVSTTVFFFFFPSSFPRQMSLAVTLPRFFFFLKSDLCVSLKKERKKKK